MKLTALTPIKHGTKDGVEEVAIGESFEVADKKQAQRLIDSGDAVAGGKPRKTEDDKEAERQAAEQAAIDEANAKADREREETAAAEAAANR